MSEKRTLEGRKKVALVAHDNMKSELIDWAVTNKTVLEKQQLFATGTTCEKLEEQLKLPIAKLFSGPLGGDQQIGSMVAEGKLDFLVFFWDPLEAQPHDSDVKALQRLAVAWNILLASNRSTADFIVSSLLMQKTYEI